MTIAVLGAGAMGQLFGGLLAAAGKDVHFIDVDPTTVEVLASNGVTVVLDSREHHASVTASLPEHANGPADMVLLFTKSFHLGPAMEACPQIFGADTAVVSLQNGLGHLALLRRSLGSAQVVLGVTTAPSDMVRPGLVHSTRESRVVMGAMDGISDVAAVRSVLSATGFDIVGVPDVHVSIWEKLAFNAGLNLTSAVTGRTVGEMGADDHIASLVERVVSEVVSVARAEGVGVDEAAVHDAIRSAYRDHGEHQTSMLRDVLDGRPTEVESIGGAVVELARAHRLRTPILARLCEDVRAGRTWSHNSAAGRSPHVCGS